MLQLGHSSLYKFETLTEIEAFIKNLLYPLDKNYPEEGKGDDKGGRMCKYESGPGEMAQFDWSEYTIEPGGKLKKVFVFCTIPGYSRYRRYGVSLDAKQASVIGAIEDGFRYFGGVPRKVFIDNAKCMVIRHKRGGMVEWNSRFLEFMGYYNVEPRACRPSRPQTKGGR